jgi:6-phosphogluconolactonase
VSGEPVVLDEPAAEAADRIARAAGAGGHVVLAGGNTPRAAYERLAPMDLDWSGCVVWFGDERCVPPDDERSNFRMVRESLLDPIGPAGPEVRRIEGELGPSRAADAYERQLRDTFGSFPSFDLVLLGIGPDGHTASLFPGQPTLDERDRAVVGVERAGREPYVPRVTLTLPAINAAREVIFLVAGEDKAGPVARAIEGPPDPATPASMVAPESGSLTWLLDPAAAAELDGAG